MQDNTPIDYTIVNEEISKLGIEDFSKISIREIVRFVNNVEKRTGDQFIRMEMGIPGLETPEIGINAEIEALKRGVSSKYPMIDGIEPLKDEFSRFLKLFLNIDIDRQGCIPTVGSMQGGFASFLVANRNDHTKEGTLFIDPGFPVQKQQCRVIGHNYHTFDVYNYRGDKLRDKLESYLKTGKISTILYSSPNNPAWFCLTDKELRIIGELANKYDAIVIEDLAYFGMDFREDYSKPGVAPYQPTIAHYTDHYILLISSSKFFSYAGQRIAMMAISDKLYNREYPDLKRYFNSAQFGHCMIYGALYSLSSGTCHSAQYGLAALLKAVNDGKYNFIDGIIEYKERATVMKRLFTENGFDLVYDKDEDEPIADGFYFTVSYPGLTSGELLKELAYYGISAISLEITGSERREGIRGCVSFTGKDKFGLLEERLKQFHADHK